MSEDFLDTGDIREKQRVEAVEYAKLYLAVFVHTPAGAKLLKEWEERILRKPVPIGSSINEFVAAESLRQFILGIQGQIRLASTEGR